jgi:hypothetical protein
LRFFGHGVAAPDLDRVKIALGNPTRPVNLGATDFTVEFWLKATPGANQAGVCAPGSDNWITGNIIFDRDVYGGGDYGDWGIALFQTGLAFGVHNGSEGVGLCGTSGLADGQWRHVAAQRRWSDGWLWLFVDGLLQAEMAGPDGDLHYRVGRTTSYPQSDPFLVIGAEKHDAGAAYPSFSGWLDEVRLSTVLRYTANFTRPTGPFAPDSVTAALYHFDEGSGDVILDSANAAGGPSHGVRRFGGSPAGPLWSADTPWGAPVETPTASHTPGATPSATPVPAAATATPTVTTSPQPPTTTPMPSPTATTSPTTTLAPTVSPTRFRLLLPWVTG